MRSLVNVLMLIVILNGCRGTKFNYATDEFIKDNLGTLQPIHIDDSYDLYLRQVIKVKDPNTQRYTPQNRNSGDNATIIEIQYLLYSEKYKKVLVLNNIPDSKEKFYNSQDKLIDLASEETKIDIWYLRQFRFGKILDNSQLKFSNIEGSQKAHIWNISFLDRGNTIRVNSLRQGDEFGEETRNINTAFSLEILFKKVKDFKFVFKHNASKSLESINVEETDLPNNEFFLAKRGNKMFVVFKFNQLLSEHYKNVYFFNERIYSTWE